MTDRDDLVARANAQFRAEQAQVPAPLRPCRWAFDEGPTREGFTDDTTWNGWARVWVTTDVLGQLLASWEEDDNGANALDNESKMDLVDVRNAIVHEGVILTPLDGYTVHLEAQT